MNKSANLRQLWLAAPGPSSEIAPGCPVLWFYVTEHLPVDLVERHYFDGAELRPGDWILANCGMNSDLPIITTLMIVATRKLDGEIVVERANLW